MRYLYSKHQIFTCVSKIIKLYTSPSQFLRYNQIYRIYAYISRLHVEVKLYSELNWLKSPELLQCIN